MKDIISVDDYNASAAVATAYQRESVDTLGLGYQYDSKVKGCEE